MIGLFLTMKVDRLYHEVVAEDLAVSVHVCLPKAINYTVICEIFK